MRDRTKHTQNEKVFVYYCCFLSFLLENQVFFGRFDIFVVVAVVVIAAAGKPARA